VASKLNATAQTPSLSFRFYEAKRQKPDLGGRSHAQDDLPTLTTNLATTCQAAPIPWRSSKFQISNSAM
jgi:hypothetical protein